MQQTIFDLFLRVKLFWFFLGFSFITIGCAADDRLWSIEQKAAQLNELNQSGSSDTVEVPSEEVPAEGLLGQLEKEDLEQQMVLDLDEIDACFCTWTIVERQGMACLKRECQGSCENVECQEIGEICLPLQ